MRAVGKTSIAALVIVLIVTIVSLLLAAVGTIGYRTYADRQRTAFRSALELGADQLAIGMSPAAWSLEYTQIEKLMESQMRDTNIEGVFVQLDRKRFILGRDPQGRVIALDQPGEAGSLVTTERTLTFGSQVIGKVRVLATSAHLERELGRALAYLVLSALLLDFILSVSLYVALQRLVLRPLRLVERYADGVARGVPQPAELGSFAFQGELDSLRTSIDLMIRQLATRNAELGEAKERFERVIRLFPIPVALFELGGRIAYINEAFSATFGYAPQDVPTVDEWFAKAYPDPAYRHEVFEDWAHDLRVAAETGIPLVPRAYRVTCKDGSVLTVEIRGISSESPSVGVLIDITERARAESELARHREHLEELVSSRTAELQATYKQLAENQFAMDHAGIGIAWIDAQTGRFLYVNDHTCRINGYSQKEMLALSIAELSADYRNGRFDAFVKLLTERGFVRTEVSLRRKDGTLVPVEMAMYYQHKQGDGAGYFIAFAIDITQRKEAENALVRARVAAESAAQSRSDFLAAMSHEIRTPMNAVIGMTQLALLTPLARKPRDYINKARLSAVSLLGILNDILDFSKVEAGRLEIETVAFRLEDVLDNLVSITGLKAEEKGLEFLIDVSADTPEMLVGDPTRLQQVLVNLVGNAIKFTERGTVNLRCRPIDGGGDAVTLEFKVQDSGIGMQPEQQAALFKPFFQADSSISRRYGGTGLGLAISRRLVELMGGAISAESRAGLGSTFTFSVQFRPAAAGAAPGRARSASLAFRGRRALVVDDNPTSLDILDRLITDFGFAVDRADGGPEALRCLEHHARYDLMVCDWKMPGMDGLELVRAIGRDAQRQMPGAIIMVSACGVEGLREAAADLNLAGLLAKPVSPSTLLDAILDAFGEPRLHSQEDPSRHLPPPPGVRAELRGVRVLVVEDNALNQEVARELLTSAGAYTAVASNGQEALQLLEEQDFDCVLMDVQMPVMDGLEATRAIRRQERWQKLPVIAMTAGALLEEREETRRVGMNGHLTKPINFSELVAAVAHWGGLRTADEGNARLQAPPAPVLARAVPTEELRSGFDAQAGIAVLGGNEARYRRILKMFVAGNRDLPQRLQAAFTDRDMKALAFIAHRTKGAASSIGALAVAQAARGLESACSDAAVEAPVAAYIDTLIQALATTGVELARYLEGDESPPGLPEVADVQPGLPWSSAVPVVAQLLADGDTDAAEVLSQVLDDHPPDAVVRGLADVLRLAQDFAFDEALARLRELPGTAAAETPIQPADAAAAGLPARPSVLVVDDVPANIEVVRGILRDEYRVLAATTGEKALALACGARPPDLILMDLMMPDMSGFEVCRRLLADQRGAAVPVILVSARDDEAAYETGFDLGAVDYLTKPVQHRLLRARVRAALALHRQDERGRP